MCVVKYCQQQSLFLLRNPLTHNLASHMRSPPVLRRPISWEVEYSQLNYQLEYPPHTCGNGLDGKHTEWLAGGLPSWHLLKPGLCWYISGQVWQLYHQLMRSPHITLGQWKSWSPQHQINMTKQEHIHTLGKLTASIEYHNTIILYITIRECSSITSASFA